MKKRFLGAAGAAALGFAALASQSAQAQGLTVQFGGPGYYGRSYGGPYIASDGPYYGGPAYGGYYGRPAYGYGPRCFVRVNRYWDGYGWVRERRRICR